MNKELRKGIESCVKDLITTKLTAKQLKILAYVINNQFHWQAVGDDAYTLFDIQEDLDMDSGEINKELNHLEACGLVEDVNGVVWVQKDFLNKIALPLSAVYSPDNRS